jgi:hypothetical protein
MAVMDAAFAFVWPGFSSPRSLLSMSLLNVVKRKAERDPVADTTRRGG